MICKDCMYYGNCIMAEPDGVWIACDDFVEKCDNDCEHCEWTECILEKPKENKIKTNKFEEIKLKTTKLEDN